MRIKFRKVTTGLLSLLLTVVTIIACLSWRAQTNELVNTKWKGTMYVPNAADVVISFKKDDVQILMGGRPIETMSYQLNGDTITLKKSSGGSPCTNETGIYKYITKNNVLSFATVKDDCPTRVSAFSTDGYKKVTE